MPKNTIVFDPRLRRFRDTITGRLVKPLDIYWFCAYSPTGAHHFIIDSLNNGICCYCKKEERFSTKLPDVHVIKKVVSHS